MNRSKRHLWVLALVFILLAVPTVVVFAKELGSLTIKGPGIDGEMTLNHPASMMKLESEGFFDQTLSIKPPENLGDGYNITAYLNLDGKIVPFVQMVYYATDGSEPGYVHYTARLTGDSLQPVDQWRQLNKDAEIAFRGLMDEYKITLQPAVVSAAEAAPVAKSAVEAQPALKGPVAEPAAAPVKTPVVPLTSNTIVLVSVTSLLVLLGAGLMFRRRTGSQRSS